jgi:adenosylcobinamide-GDP ribazoletransferase
MKFLKDMIAAFQFLTSIPIPIKTDEENLKKSIIWFPLVGGVIGIISGFGYQFLIVYFNQELSAVFTIFIYIVLTRGLHLDGFMDTIDGFSSRKDREKILKIMKDSYVGSFAVLGAGIWLLIMVNALPLLKPVDIILIHTFSRFNITLMPLVCSYPRKSGIGQFFVENVNKYIFAIEVSLFLIILSVLNTSYFKYLFLSFLVSLIIGKWSNKMIGGITGDTIGFTVEATNLILILSIVIQV